MTDLRARCREFVEEQSAGEWGDELVAKDAEKLAAFVSSEVASAVAGERELSIDEVIAEVAEWPTTSETPGVARDYELDEWIGAARALRARSSAATGKGE